MVPPALFVTLPPASRSIAGQPEALTEIAPELLTAPGAPEMYTPAFWPVSCPPARLTTDPPA